MKTTVIARMITKIMREIFSPKSAFGMVQRSGATPLFVPFQFYFIGNSSTPAGFQEGNFFIWKYLMGLDIFLLNDYLHNLNEISISDVIGSSYILQRPHFTEWKIY